MNRRNILQAPAAGLLGAPAAVPAAVAADNPDAALIGWCAALIAMEAAYRNGTFFEYPAGHADTLRAVTETPAQTIEGNRAKLAVGVAFYQPDFPNDSIVDPLLWDAVQALALPPAASPVVAPPHLDAELLAMVDQHMANRAAFNADLSSPGDDDDPLLLAYEHTLDAIAYAKPQTMEGILAKAQAARAEAEPEWLDGHGPSSWAWHVVNDLLRLEGHAA